MNSRLDLKLDKQAFLHWAEGREGRFELKGNRVVMMNGGTKGHARIISRLLVALSQRLDAKLWSVTPTDLAVEIGEDIRYPDIIIEPLDTANSALSTSNPIFVAEVLSPSSLTLDLRDKAAEYMSLPSLEGYLVAAQDDARMWLWQRLESGNAKRLFPPQPLELAGPQAVLHLARFDLQISLQEIYGGIVMTH